MKKATFIATIIFFLGFMGYLSPKEAKAIIIVDGFAGPFSIVDGSQAAQVNVVNVSPNADDLCQVEVKFFDQPGNEIEGARCMMTLRGNSIQNCDFVPEDAGMRKQNLAQVVVSNRSVRACMILITTEVYNMDSHETTAVYEFMKAGQVSGIEPQPF
jgi:hypothetical protein